jgi:gas vesicle protein
MMKEYEIEVDDSTASLLDAIANAEDDPFVIASLADVSVDEVRQFMADCGEDSTEAMQLLRAAELLEQSKLSRQQLYRPTVHKSQFQTDLIYLLLGAGVGAILALLFAPKSGKELRSEIADVTRRGLDPSEVERRSRAQNVGRVELSQTMTGEWDASETGQNVHEKKKRKTEASGGLGVAPRLDERAR